MALLAEPICTTPILPPFNPNAVVCANGNWSAVWGRRRFRAAAGMGGTGIENVGERVSSVGA